MKNFMVAVGLVGLLLGGAACGKSKDGEKTEGATAGKAVGGKMDRADAFFLESIQKDIVKVKDDLTKGEDPKYTCVAAKSYAEELAGKDSAEATAAVKELTQLCNYDVPMAALEKEVVKAEAARAAKPDDTTLSECYSAYRDMAVDALKAPYASDDKFKALSARWDVVCPAS